MRFHPRTLLRLVATVAFLSGGVGSNGRAQGADPVEETFLTADGVQLHGLFTKSTKNSGTDPVVILLYPPGKDNTMAKGDWKGLATLLSKQGYNVFQFDWRGHGKLLSALPFATAVSVVRADAGEGQAGLLVRSTAGKTCRCCRNRSEGVWRWPESRGLLLRTAAALPARSHRGAVRGSGGAVQRAGEAARELGESGGAEDREGAFAQQVVEGANALVGFKRGVRHHQIQIVGGQPLDQRLVAVLVHGHLDGVG